MLMYYSLFYHSLKLSDRFITMLYFLLLIPNWKTTSSVSKITNLLLFCNSVNRTSFCGLLVASTWRFPMCIPWLNLSRSKYWPNKSKEERYHSSNQIHISPCRNCLLVTKYKYYEKLCYVECVIIEPPLYFNYCNKKT